MLLTPLSHNREDPMEFHKMIQLAAERLQLASNMPADATSLEIRFKDGVALNVEYHEEANAVSLASLLCFYPPESQKAALFEALLHGHAFGLLTGGASFGADPEAGKVFLFKTLPLDRLDGDGFVEALQGFHGVSRAWKEAYDSGRLLGTSAAPSGRPASSPVPMGTMA